MTGTPSHAAVIYARISQDRTGAGLGVERQEAECRALAAQLGWPVVEVFADNDISAYSGKPRPGYRALLAALETGTVSGVLAWHTDRLHRSPLELEAYIDVCERMGVTTHTVRAGHLDLSTSTGRMTARITGAVARQESEHKGDRVRAARRQAAAEGKYLGSTRPFGYESDGMTLRPAEAMAIAEATDAILNGGSLRSVARDWNERGLTTTFKAKEWQPRTVADVLMRPRNAGLAQYLGEVVGKAQWPAIVPEERWRGLVALLRDDTRRTNRQAGGQPKWLGSGLYVCGVCSQPKLRVSRSGNRQPAYRCASRDYTPAGPGSGGHVVRNAEYLDNYVSALIVERLSRPDAVTLLREPAPGIDLDGLHASAAALRARMTEAAKAHADGLIGLTELTAGSRRMRERLDEIEQTIAAAEVGDPVAGLVGAPNVGELWADLDIAKRRAVLAEVMTVTVLPSGGKRGPSGSRFDPAGVQIEWRR